MTSDYTPFRLPADFYRHNRRFIFLLTVNGLARALAVVAVFHFVRQAVSRLQLPQQEITDSLLVLLALAAFLLAMRMHERYVAEKMSQRYINRLRQRLLSRLMRVSSHDVDAVPSGALAARLGGDLSSLRRWLSLGMSRLIVNTILLLAAVGVIALLNKQAGMITAILLIALTLLSLRFGANLREALKAVRSIRIRIQSLLVERIDEMAMIRVMGQEGREIRKINKLGKKLERKASTQGLLLGGLRGLGEAGGVVLIIAVFAVYRFSGQSIDGADAAAVISLVMFMSGPIRELGRVQEYYRGAAISLVKLSELFNMRRITRGASRYVAQSRPGTIEFKNVSYPPAVKDFSAEADVGERVAITGRNGSGKTTLLRLAVGLIKPYSGTVRLGGVDPRRLSPDARAEMIGVFGPGFGLLRGGLEFNITYRRPEATADELHRAITRFDLGALFTNLGDGREKLIRQGAKNISAGEFARIGLARATLGTPGILILDEPESNLDLEGLQSLQQLIETWPGTVFLITHEQSLIKLCHQVWDMDCGDGQARGGKVTLLREVQRR